MRARFWIAAALAGLLTSLSAVAHGGEVTQRTGLRIYFEGKISPQKLPRRDSAPVRVAVEVKIAATEGRPLPHLRAITIAINRHGHFDPTGLPVCKMSDVQPATTRDALRACGGSLVGTGRFAAAVPEGVSSPFPSQGKLYAFSGTYRGKPAILAHVFGEQPLPVSYTIPFLISGSAGTFGTTLGAKLPGSGTESGSVTELSMDLGRNFTFHGKRRSYVSAACPVPPGIHVVSFPFARASFDFGQRKITSTISRTCRPRG